MINFDNAATTFPKPDSVRQAMNNALLKYGGNPGRSGHALSIATARAVYRVREMAADFFDAEPENVVFTSNCTHALNVAIQGIMSGGGHIITSTLEHNSVIRPINSLVKKGICTASTVAVAPDDVATLIAFKDAMRTDTKAIVCTAASNVTGQMLPYQQIGRLCRERGICFILDGAQGSGVLPISLKRDNISILCTAGHKGLYGPSGTGLLVTDGQFKIEPLMQGGTGTASIELDQPIELPDSLESGTVNTCGIIALGAGIEFVRSIGLKRILSHEQGLCDMFLDGLRKIPGSIVYRNRRGNYVPIVSFNMSPFTANEFSDMLSQRGFCLRSGIHCAAFAHKSLNTVPDGTVRFSPGAFNTKQQVSELIQACTKR